MRYLLLPLCLIILALWVLDALMVYTRDPHGDYLRREYGSDLTAFVTVEEKIDMFLLKLENR